VNWCVGPAQHTLLDEQTWAFGQIRLHTTRANAANAAGAARSARPLAGGLWLNQSPGTARYDAWTASNTLGSADLALGRLDARAERARLARTGLAGWGWLEAGILGGEA